MSMTDKAFPNLERVVEDCGCAPEALLSKARAELKAARVAVNELCEGHDLVVRLLTHVTHGKPTEAEAQDWTDSAERAIDRCLPTKE